MDKSNPVDKVKLSVYLFVSVTHNKQIDKAYNTFINIQQLMI